MTTSQTDLLHWFPLLESHQDRLSQLAVTHAVLSGFDMTMLAFTLELDESELIERWSSGIGLTDITSDTREALAELIDVPSWHIWFLSGELNVMDFMPSVEAETCAEKAKSRWDVIREVNDEVIAVFTQLLAGDPLLDSRFWDELLEDIQTN